MPVFEEVAPECARSVNVTSFRYEEKTYTISTTDIRHLHVEQRYHDRHAGYTGILGNYETMLFIDQNSMVYPFADMPGWPELGVFQRYETEDAARDGHQDFVTRVQRILLKSEQHLTDEQRDRIIQRFQKIYLLRGQVKSVEALEAATQFSVSMRQIQQMADEPPTDITDLSSAIIALANGE
jgi:hypothetical protein